MRCLLVLVAVAGICCAAQRRGGGGGDEEPSRVATGPQGDGEALELLEEPEPGTGRVREPELSARREATTAEPSPAVREAIRDLLAAGDPDRERRGERLLKRFGPAIAPQLRYWLDRVSFEQERVRQVLREIQTESGAEPQAVDRELAVNEFFHLKLLEARKLLRSGKPRDARRIAEALLVLDEESPVAWELRRLRRDARDRVLAERLEPRIDCDRLIYEVGETPKVSFRVINHSRSTATIGLDRGVLGQIKVEIDLRSVDSTRADARQLALRAPKDASTITLRPGALYEQDIPLEGLSDAMALSGMVARVRISGDFRPLRWQIEGEREKNLPIPFVPAELWIVPPAQRAGLEAPHERLFAALFFGDLEGFLVGAQLGVWAGKKDPVIQEAVVETLVSYLGEFDPPRRGLAFRLLTEATGESFKEPREWQDWWAKYRTLIEPDPPPRVDVEGAAALLEPNASGDP